MKVKTQLDSSKLSSKSIVGGKLLNLNKVLQVYFLHGNSNNATKSASSDLIGPRRKISIFSRGNALTKVKVIKPPAFDTEHETTTTDDDIKKRLTRRAWLSQPNLKDYIWTSIKQKYHKIPSGTIAAWKRTQYRISKEGRQKAKRKKQPGSYYKQNIPVYAMQHKKKDKIKNVERILGVVEPETVPSRTKKMQKPSKKSRGKKESDKKESSKKKTVTKESEVIEKTEGTIKVDDKYIRRAGETEPDLDWVNRHYVRIVGTFPRNEREFALARLQKQSQRFVLARVGYRGPNAGLRGTKATVVTWGGVPAATTCSCPYDFCTCKGNPIGANSQYPCGVLKCDVWGGFVKFFSWIGLGSLVARIRRKPATFGPSLIRAIGEAKRAQEKTGGKGDQMPPDTCLTGCHAYYRKNFDDGLVKRKRRKTSIITSDLDESSKKKKKKKRKKTVVEEEEEEKPKKKKPAKEVKEKKPKGPTKEELKAIKDAERRERELAEANRLELLRLEAEARKAAEAALHGDKCNCCKFCVGTEEDTGGMSTDFSPTSQPTYQPPPPPQPQQPMQAPPPPPQTVYATPPPPQQQAAYAPPPPQQAAYAPPPPQQAAYAPPPPQQQVAYGPSYGPHPLDPSLLYGMPACGPYGAPPTYGQYSAQYEDGKKKKKKVTYGDETYGGVSPVCQGECLGYQSHSKSKPKEWCGPDCKCGSLLCAMRRAVSTHVATPCVCPVETVQGGTQNSVENKNIAAEPTNTRTQGTTGRKGYAQGTGTTKTGKRNAKL